MTVRRTPTESVQQALAALAAGGMIAVVDDADRENEGDLVVAAELVTPAQMAFFDEAVLPLLVKEGLRH